MTRPNKRTVDYFPHYAVQGKTLLILQNEFGNDGYAFWFKLLELLCRTDGHVYDYNNSASWRLLLAETSVKEDTVNKILQLLADIDAIDKELYIEKTIWVQNLVDNLEGVYQRRSNSAKPERPVIVNNNEVNVNRNTQTKQNKTKLNKTIYTSLFDHWNQSNIITHKKLTIDMKKAIDSVLANYSEDEVKQAISNYAEIVNGAQYYFDHKWTLVEFTKREHGNNIERFLDLEIAKANFRKDDKAPHVSHGPRYSKQTQEEIDAINKRREENSAIKTDTY